jgi:hypothetical protein
VIVIPHDAIVEHEGKPVYFGELTMGQQLLVLQAMLDLEKLDNQHLQEELVRCEIKLRRCDDRAR